MHATLDKRILPQGPNQSIQAVTRPFPGMVAIPTISRRTGNITIWKHGFPQNPATVQGKTQLSIKGTPKGSKGILYFSNNCSDHSGLRSGRYQQWCCSFPQLCCINICNFSVVELHFALARRQISPYEPTRHILPTKLPRDTQTSIIHVVLISML